MAKRKVNIAKIVNRGEVQMIMLPKNIHVPGKEVEVEYNGESKIILHTKKSSLDEFFLSDEKCSSDFMQNRNDDLPQSRNILNEL